MKIPEEILLLIPLIVGGIAVPLINILKELVKSEDPRVNLGIALGVSVVLAVMAMAITGQFNQPPSAALIVGWISMVFSVATLIYKGTVKPIEKA